MITHTENATPMILSCVGGIIVSVWGSGITIYMSSFADVAVAQQQQNTSVELSTESDQ